MYTVHTRVDAKAYEDLVWFPDRSTYKRMCKGGRKGLGKYYAFRGYWNFDCLLSAHFTEVALVNYQQVSE